MRAGGDEGCPGARSDGRQEGEDLDPGAASLGRAGDVGVPEDGGQAPGRGVGQGPEELGPAEAAGGSHPRPCQRIEAGDEVGGNQGLQKGRQPAVLEGGRRLAEGGPARRIGARQGPALALGPEPRARQDIKDRAPGGGQARGIGGGCKAQEAPVAEGGDVGVGDHGAAAPGGRRKVSLHMGRA